MNRPRALAAIHFSALLFGLTGVFGEAIQTDATAITAGRALFACIALAGFAQWRRSALTAGIRRREILVLIGASLLLALHWISFFYAVKVGGIAVATLGFASFPAVITLFEALVLREPVARAEWALLGLVSSGLVLVVPDFDLGNHGTAGLLWGLLSGCSFGMLAIVNRHAMGHIDPIQIAFWQNLFVAVLVLPLGIQGMLTMNGADWFWLLLLGVFCTGLSHYLFVSSLSVLNARSAGLVISLEPVYAIAAAWGLFNQVPGTRMLLGAALIIGAIMGAGLRKPANTASKP